MKQCFPALILLMLSGGVSAQSLEQTISTNPENLILAPNETQIITVDYQDVSGEGVMSFTLQTFFSEAQLNLVPSVLFSSGSLNLNVSSTLQLDSDDLDNDTTTTHYFTHSWIDENIGQSNWPASGADGAYDVSLLTLTVTARETFSGPAAINFVKFEGGPEFTANSVQVNRFIPAPNFIEEPSSVTVQADSLLTEVSLIPPAVDDASAVLTNDAPMEGFGFGETIVTWTATNMNGLTSTITQTVIVMEPLAPEVTFEPELAFEAVGVLSALPTSLLQLADADADYTITRDPATELPLGTHEITWTVTNSTGQSTTVTQTVTIADTTAPVFDELPPVTIDATGVTTLVTAETLLPVTATDNLDGDLVAELVTNEPLVSGEHVIEWQVSDAQGNRAVASQTIRINPQVVIQSLDFVELGDIVQAHVSLLGEAPVYPVIIDYTVTSSAEVSFDNLMPLSIDGGQTGTITLALPNDGTLDAGDTIAIALTSGENAVISGSPTYVANLILGNEAPIVGLALQQGDAQTRIVFANAEPVIITASVADINLADSHSLTFDTLHPELIDLNQDDDPQTFEFSADALAPGVYVMTVTASETNTEEALSSSTELLFIVESEAVVLSAENDTDKDGIPDSEEGLSDSDNDGIPDFQDNSEVTSQLPLDENFSNPLETAPGMTLRLGTTAIAAQGVNASHAVIDTEQLTTHGDDGESTEDATDTDFEAISDIVDFEVINLPAVGISVPIIIPLPDGVSLSANTVYRKFDASIGWVTFIDDGDNTIGSAPLTELGQCPRVDSEAYIAGLNEGHQCVKLTLVDGGIYDQDGEANGKVADPGVFAVEVVNLAPTAVISGATSISENQTLMLDASASNDPESQSLSYGWQQVAGPSATLEANGAMLTVSAPDITSDTTLSFTVTVSDGKNETTSEPFDVVVTPQPSTVIAQVTASGSQTNNQFNPGSTVTLNAGGSTDSDGNLLTYSWIQTAGSSVALSSTSTASVSFTAPSATTSSVLSFTVTVSNGQGADTSVDEKSISVTIAAQSNSSSSNTGGGSSNSSSSGGGGSTGWLILCTVGIAARRRVNTMRVHG